MQKERYKILNWFFEFAYADFDQMPAAEINFTRAKLTVLLNHGVWSRPDDKTIEFMTTQYLGLTIEIDETERLKAIQAAFRQTFHETMGAIGNLPSENKSTTISQSSGSWGPVHVLFQHFMPAITLQAQITTIPAEVLSSKKFSDGAMKVTDVIDTTGIPNGKQLFKKGWRKNACIEVISQHADPVALLGTIFLREINGAPLGVFRQCEACARWFLHTSAKKRRFCANRCAARISNRERRAKVKANDPKRYRDEAEAGKKRSRKSYKRKIGLIHEN